MFPRAVRRHGPAGRTGGPTNDRPSRPPARPARGRPRVGRRLGAGPGADPLLDRPGGQRRSPDCQAKLAAGSETLDPDEHGYLRSVLAALNVPESSQVLVFSKTSFQRHRITPEDAAGALLQRRRLRRLLPARRRARVLRGRPQARHRVLHARPGAGRRSRSSTARRTTACICHASTATGGVPGHLVRSVFTDRVRAADPVAAGTFRTDHTSPFAERWGGWYVTGTHGKQTHMGNWVAENKKRPGARGQRRRPERHRAEVAVHGGELPDAAQRHRGADGPRAPDRGATTASPGDARRADRAPAARGRRDGEA